MSKSITYRFNLPAMTAEDRAAFVDDLAATFPQDQYTRAMYYSARDNCWRVVVRSRRHVLSNDKLLHDYVNAIARGPDHVELTNHGTYAAREYKH